MVDAVGRWHRLIGDEVYTLTGTDEHGLKVARSAKEAGRSPQEQADVNSERFREIANTLGLEFNDFIRTTEQRHHKAVQAFMQKIYDNGYIYADTYSGSYCVSCEAYYNDEDLIEGNCCPVHKRPVESMTEDNYFFKLSAFSERLTEWFEHNPDNVRPSQYRSEALGLLKQGLEDVSISRTSIDWGIPIPWDSDHVFYVWYDALINYVTAMDYGTDMEHFNKWWPSAHHFIGKDILRFHTIYWPAMLMAAGIEDIPRFHVHGYLLLGGEKMSKSGNVTKIAPSEMTSVFGVDGFRHALLAGHPFGPDSEFSYESVLIRYNSELANSYGNLISRVATIVGKKCGGIGPKPNPDSPLAEIARSSYENTFQAWQRVAPSVALEATWKLIRAVNEYLQETEPWKLEPGAEVDQILGDCLEAIRIATILVQPSIPTAAKKAWERMNFPSPIEDQRLPEAAQWGLYEGGTQIETGEPLFPRIKGD